MKTSHHRSGHGFTLVELLVVIAIIAILAGLFFPIVGKMNERGKQTECISHLRNSFTACMSYSNDNGGALVPGYRKDENGNTSHWATLIIPYYGETNNNFGEKYSCPKWKEATGGSASAYQWGYAMNVTPLYEGPASTSQQKTVNLAEATGAPDIRLINITHQNTRLYLCDSKQWHVRGQQVAVGNPGQTLASYDRHGKDICNAMFFDGHAEPLYPRGIDTALQDPANFRNTLD